MTILVRCDVCGKLVMLPDHRIVDSAAIMKRAMKRPSSGPFTGMMCRCPRNINGTKLWPPAPPVSHE